MDKHAPVWQANQVRFAIFSPAPAPTPSLDIWRNIAGADPEAEDFRPREGIKRQIGQFSGGNLEVTATPGRVDVAMLPLPMVDPLSGTVPELFFKDARAQLAQLAEPYRDVLRSFQAPVLRIAVICGAIMPASSVEESYAALSKLIKSAKIDPRMKDILYRVNWRLPSDIVGVEYYNRLTTFSAFMIQGGITPTPVGDALPMRERFYASMELDINTPAERQQPLAMDERVPIFDSLLRLVDENLDRGEVV